VGNRLLLSNPSDDLELHSFRTNAIGYMSSSESVLEKLYIAIKKVKSN
jgi:hypothetical protein